ncbi:ATP-binding protein [Arthrobacter sp. PAMC 25486]|uniref:ATP-binding protein n=1 Tax=Arthrobacter sp. PAMC 25486 TaxID=1494608 RepID=UPI0009DE597A
MVLQNLVQNAIRYAGSAGPIEVHAHRGPTWIRLEVLNGGAGIREPERAAGTFHREAGQENPGTGLGVENTAQTIEYLGGGLKLLHRAREGSGTLAHATIPLDEPSEEPHTLSPSLEVFLRHLCGGISGARTSNGTWPRMSKVLIGAPCFSGSRCCSKGARPSLTGRMRAFTAGGG